jgi:coenzyme F420-reducing hydrogenase delta subunit
MRLCHVHLQAKKNKVSKRQNILREILKFHSLQTSDLKLFLISSKLTYEKITNMKNRIISDIEKLKFYHLFSDNHSNPILIAKY